ncbi:MAG: amidohydrolase family protein [Planctomyces sp.]|nr:amidohydrolase family protein [Planctomyces sp.]
MTDRIGRRSFLAGALAAPMALACAEVRGQEQEQPPAPATLDLHIHLFGTGDAGSGCRLSNRITSGWQFNLLLSRFRGRAGTLDESYVVTLVEDLKASGLARGLILAQDAVYDAAGKPDWKQTHFFAPNDYLFRVVDQHRDLMFPCVSINPNRADAVDELDRCVDKGARALKIHPPTQNVDIADPKHTRFFQRCADHRILVLVHTGHEHSAPVQDIGLASPLKLEPALDQGCTVVACHCGTGWPGDKPDMLPDFLTMLRKYERLWGDSSVLCTIGHAADCLRLIDDELGRERLLHGSDFPFPCAPIAFSGIVKQDELTRIRTLDSELARDLALKDALGIGRTCAERAHQLVAG